MLAAATLEEYLARPVGRYLPGPTYVVWWLHPGLNGISFWGRPEAEHIRVVTSALEAEFRPEIRRHASVIDARCMDGVDPGAFDRLSGFVSDYREQLARGCVGQAVLRPSGLVGAVVAGFHAVLDTLYPVKVFPSLPPALDWLRVNEDASVFEALDGIRASAVGASPLVMAVRQRLQHRPGAATLKEVARALGLSSRDLQRQLCAAHTRFKTEQRAAQIHMAKTLLMETSYDVKRIAVEVGCSSSQHFSSLFRECVGETPSGWRGQRSAVFATSGHSSNARSL